ncbi:SPOSA6832_00459 [Sporobolomyces salmonicolor]|uniref:SPOSA6832_00459-mRNA-1:cds n=1 Tax=Sporidiobolus salmonicolor TaxID=5005 RepID=A0A0D6EGG1_SPOSA|nr:SPOSA6832_00459 [Sporobolomyces salmonicolor]
MPSFPSRFSFSSWSARDDLASTAGRERRVSFGVVGAKGKGKATEEDPTDPASSLPSSTLKRSKTARSSLIVSAARRLSTAAGAAGTRSRMSSRDKLPPISTPILREHGEDDNDVLSPPSFMREYQTRAMLFAQSSPELARTEVGDAGVDRWQWAVWPQPSDVSDREIELQSSPRLRWHPKGENQGVSSFVPLSPRSVRPYDASEGSLNPLSDASTEISTGSDTPVLSSSALPIRRARSPQAKWSVPVLQTSPSPPPAAPAVSGDRALSRSPPVDEVTRAAARAEALAKLTSPTPTGSKFPDGHLDAFPFPVVTPTPSSPPPRPSRPLPPLPPHAGSTSLILTPAHTAICTPPLTRSNTISLHPSPSAALDIDLRGRLVRARNSHPSPSLTLSSSPSSSAFGSLRGGGSPASSRFGEWGMSGSRKSSQTSLSLSITPSTPEKEPAGSNSIGGAGSLYALADRRMAESAVDILAVVEEDEAPLMTSAARAVRRTSMKRSPSKAKQSDSPRRRAPLATLSTQSPDVLTVSRTRPRLPSTSSNASGKLDLSVLPCRVSQNCRSFSSGAAIEPTQSEKEEFGSRFTDAGGATKSTGKVNFVHTTRPSLGEPIPFPSASSPCIVAVKRIQLQGKTEREVNQLSNEVSLLQRLAHPSVVKYEGLVRTEHYLNIILDYVVKILEGLAYLHNFGVSLNLDAIKNTKGINDAAEDVNGTPNWMAPEVIEMKGALPASDIWSLGCVVVELIDGRPPYADLVAMSAMFRIVEDENGPPVPERCSDDLKAFLARCFKKDPKERPSAEELFEDPWLIKHWDRCKVLLALSLPFPLVRQLNARPAQDLRPQDSLPFLRRISTEYRRPTLERPRSVSPVLDRPESPYAESPTVLTAPLPPFARDEQAPRDSLDSGLVPAVECKLCGQQTKRHAVLCRDCGLVAHRRCTEFAPTCDLRAQLLGHLPHPLYRATTIASAVPAGPTASPSSFSLTDYLPFGKARRPKPTSTSSESSIPGLPPPPTTGKASSAIRHLSAMLPSKTRTPEHTPPNSLSRCQGNGLHFHPRVSAEVTSLPDRHAHTSSESSVGSSSPTTDGFALRRKLSSYLVVRDAIGGAKLINKKSHSRPQSQPVNKPKSDGECAVM